MTVAAPALSRRVRPVLRAAAARLQEVFDGGRREFVVFAGLTVLLVGLRSAVFIFVEESYFSSDQAVIALMAKHVSEFRHFPLFYYGQNYMLAVQSWFLAPFFKLATPSVATMRLPLACLNIVAALVLMRMLWRETNLRPAMAFIAFLPFILPPPFVATSLLDGNGCGAGELFLYVALLWELRRRPLGFGVLLLVAYLHREFALAVVPALVVIGVLNGTAWRAATLKACGRAATGFALAWLVMDDLRLHVYGASLALQAKQLFWGHLSYRLSDMPQRLLYMFTDAFPFLLGRGRYLLTDLGINLSGRAGSTPAALLALVALVSMTGVIVWNRGKGLSRSSWLPVFLLVVGLEMLCAYPLAGEMRMDRLPLVRYLHLALLVPAAIFALFMRVEKRARWRRLAAAAFVVAATPNLVDTVSIIRAARTQPMPGYHRQLANMLELNHIRYARAGYWDAYVVDFFTGERIVVGSIGKVRIPEYEAAVAAHPESVAFISRFPCQAAIRQFPWCIALPDQEGAR